MQLHHPLEREEKGCLPSVSSHPLVPAMKERRESRNERGGNAPMLAG